MTTANESLQFGASQALSVPKLEAYLGRVMEIAPTLIYVYNQITQSNEYSNRNVGEVLGYSKDEIQDMGEHMLLQLLHPDDVATVFTHFDHMLSMCDTDVVSVEYRVKHRNGKWIWLLSRDRVFQRDDIGAVTHHIGAAIDITSQKEAEAKALLAENRSQAFSEELKSFAYAMSHDMKAPINTMQLLMSELRNLRAIQHDSEEEDLLDMADKTMSRMRGLVDDVLDYTKTIGQDVILETVDLAQVFTDLTGILRADIRHSNASLSIGPMPKVTGSRMQLSILFQNLLHNSLKFSKSGQVPNVTVMAYVHASGDAVTIAVEDNGIGISEQKQKQIFGLFERLNTASQYDGNGIGLAICRRIASNHDSRVEITSKPGEGATFSIDLELA
ncbi:MAG: ATP-binding protein [Paracoccaceae bacterium]